MATGLVYLRPKRVVFYRVYGPYSESAPKAWEFVLDWIERMGIVDEVTCGYGLLRDNPAQFASQKRRYEACIELPVSLVGRDIGEMRFQELPGGAYARQRHVGPKIGLSDAIRDLRDNWVGKNFLDVDPRRPLIEIGLDHPSFVAPEKLRTDVCVPVMVRQDADFGAAADGSYAA